MFDYLEGNYKKQLPPYSGRLVFCRKNTIPLRLPQVTMSSMGFA